MPSFPLPQPAEPVTDRPMRSSWYAKLKALADHVSRVSSFDGVRVSQLPDPAGTVRRAIVTDATATTFNAVVAGGGSNTVPVFSNGTTWRIG